MTTKRESERNIPCALCGKAADHYVAYWAIWLCGAGHDVWAWARGLS